MTINFTEPDFLKIKESLVSFLKTKDEFKDYNFDGSGINTLVELLSYNTAYMAFYLNMVANESFLDTAVLRKSLVSRAKSIGYTPKSSKAAQAKVTIDINSLSGGGPANPSSILVPKWTKFTSTVENKVYSFLTTEAVTLTNNGAGHYIGSLNLAQGVLLTHRYTVDSSILPQQKFVLPNAGVDTSLMTVKVQASAGSSNIQSFSLAKDINVVKGNSPVYFLQEIEDEKFEIYFGDDVVGKRVVDGNIVIIEYLVTQGPVANGAKKFVPNISIGNYLGITYTTTVPAVNGLNVENTESIRSLAPKFYETQNRAVNKNDYETLIKKDYPQVEYVRVWGGEEADPPVYGKVFLALKPFGALSFNNQEKESILNSIIRPRSPVSIESVIVEPDYLQIIVNSTVKIKSKQTTLTAGAIQNAVINTIVDFKTANLLGFDSPFRYSKLVKAIDSTDVSIQNNLTEITLKYTITPPLNLPSPYTINIHNKIDMGDAANNVSAINSTGFLKDGIASFIGDDGLGALYIYRIVLGRKVIVEKNIGTVDYETGTIIIPSLTIQGVVDGSEFIHFTIVPGTNDITPLRNQILIIEEDDISVTIVDEDA